MVQKLVRNYAMRGNHQHYARMTHPLPLRHVVPTTVLTRSRLVPLTAARPVTTAHALKDKGVIDSGCSRHITGNISHLFDFLEINGGYVAFGGNPKGGKIIGKGKIRTGKLDFDDVFVKELKFNLFSVSQMCDKKNSVLFTETECIVLSSNFKLPDDNHVLLRVPRENNMYNVDLKNIVSSGDLTCLFAKATLDESNLCHRRLGHINFKTMNKLVKVVTDDYSRFSWVFFLATKDETSTILKTFIIGIENQINLKVKIVRSNNGTEFKNQDLNQFCETKRIKREFSVARNPQQNGIAERKNMTLIEAARTMLADSLLPIPFWAEAVNTACYVQNRVLVTKPHNKTPYELLLGRTPSIRFIRPFGCLVTILNTLDPLGKFDRKADEGFLVGYYVSSKAFRVFNSRTRIVQETLHINFLENQPNVVGSEPTWLFDIDTLTKSMNYQTVTIGNQPNSSACIQDNFDGDPQNTDADATFKVKEPESEVHVSLSSSAKTTKHDDTTKREAKGKSTVALSTGVRNLSEEFEDFSSNSTNMVNAASTPVTAVEPNSTNSTNTFSAADMPALEDITYSDDEEDVGADANFSNLKTNINVSHIPTTREEGIDYEEVFALVSRIEAIRLFLAYASFMGFMVYQIDVKSALLYKTIKEEVYACQPLGFDTDYPDKVYKVFKALYGLHQAPRAWYETLANYLLENGFQRGKNDQTLFIKKQKGDILLVKVYVDDIIFGSTNKDLCKAFEKLMKDKFQMSSIGELAFFLGLKVKQKQDGIFISQDKYVAKILRKFGLTDRKSASASIDTEKPLLKDPDGKDVDVHTYRSMIGSLMYLTSSRLDIMFAVCTCTRFQVTPKVSHLHVVKRIFRYLKGKPHLGLWYPKDSPFNLVAYSDSDYAGASLDRKSTTGAAASCYAQVLWIQNQLLDYSMKLLEWTLYVTNVSSTGYITTPQMYALMVNPTIYVSYIKKFWSSVSLKKKNDVVRLQALIDWRKVIITEDTVRQVLRLDDVASIDCLPNEEIFAELARMGYEKPSTNLVRNVDSSSKFYMYPRFLQLMINDQVGNLSSHTTKYTSPALTQKVFANIRRVGKGFSGVDTSLFGGMLVPQQVYDDVADDVADVVTDAEPTLPSPTPATTPPHQQELIPLPSQLETCANLTKKVGDLEQDKIAQAIDITKLKQRVRRLEKKRKLKASRGKIAKLDADKDVTLEEVVAKVAKDADVQGRLEESQAQVYHLDLEHAQKVLSMQDDEAEPAELKEVIEVVTTAKLVKENKEKDKIRTKPDKNGKRGKTWHCRRPITIEKKEKKKKIQVQGIKYANPRSVFNSS
nr:putative ribonuclease H-like domain-containing protein [Tanacetum cinerariifolium]